jgi:hypothetical protein
MGSIARRTPVVALFAVSLSAIAGAQSPPSFPFRSAPAGSGGPAVVSQSQAPAGAPSEATLGVPLYPNAVFLRSYDAGRGQRYYLYGVVTPFADLVTYYRNLLKERGNLVFEVPPTHTFELGRFREETMAFPPSVTIKDFTFSGSAGYPNPTPGAQPDRFPTVIQIVPPPPGTPPGLD